MPDILPDLQHEYRRYKDLADRAIAALDEHAFARRPSEIANSIALIIKHLAGNLRSRFTDFLTTDGEKPDRNRDGEFILAEEDTRERLLSRWEDGWRTLFGVLGTLTEADLARTVTIRGEAHTVFQALLRSVNHAAYHVGQIVYLSRLFQPESPWLTIAPGESGSHRPAYRKT